MSYNLDLVSRLEKKLTGSSTITESDIRCQQDDNAQWGWCEFSSKSNIKNESYTRDSNQKSVILTERKEKQIVNECYAYFVEEDIPSGKYGNKEQYYAGGAGTYNPDGNKPDQRGMWNKFKSFLSSQLKQIAEFIEKSSAFQSFIKNEKVEDIKKRIQSVGGKYSSAWNQAEGHNKQLAKVIATDVGFASMATLITYAAYKGTQGLSSVIEQKFGKVAGIVSKVVGLPLAGALSLIVWGSFFLYRDEMMSYIEKRYGQAKQGASNMFSRNDKSADAPVEQ